MRLRRDAGRFGAVGLIGFVLDTGVFALLRTPGSPLAADPILAKIVSTTLAIIATWLGNRYWTFPDRRRGKVLREFVEFGSVALLGMLISLACLAVSHEILGLRSVLADTIAANVIGLALGTIVRFALYRWVVFAPRAPAVVTQPTAPALGSPNSSSMASSAPIASPARSFSFSSG